MNESGQELTILSEQDESLEGQEGETKENQSRRLSAAMKPMHGSLWQIGAKMGQTFLGDRENKVKLILLGRHRSQSTAAFLACRQSPSFLHLAQLCKM
jgi:hypothetical protein